MRQLLAVLLVACSGDATKADDPSETDADSDADTDADSDADADADADADSDADTDADTEPVPDAYPTEQGFRLNGVWYPEASGTMDCGDNGVNFSTYTAGFADGTGGAGTATWVFSAIPVPPPGPYQPSAYDGATGPTEGDFVINADAQQWLSDGLTGTITVYDAGSGVTDVVWHDVGLATVFGDAGTSEEGWVQCAPTP